MKTEFSLPVLGDEQKVPVAEVRAEQASNALTEHGYGKTYWRSLEEKYQPSKYAEAAQREFTPEQTSAPKGFARRDFLQLMGASMALAGLTACSERPTEPILPYTKNPDNLVPGNPLHYASAWSLRGYASGLLVTAREGRPIKVEGNPDHPFNKGSTGVLEQALTIQLYDPQRARLVHHKGAGASWRTLRELLVTKGADWAKAGGEGLRFLMEPSSSPLGGELRAQITKRFPKAKFYSYTPVSLDNALEGARLAFGQPLTHRYDLEKADVVVALDADFLAPYPENLVATRGWGSRRGLENPNRVYSIEHRLTVTGSAADQRLRMRASEIGLFARALAAELAGSVPALGAFRGMSGGNLGAKEQKWVKAVAADLARAHGKSLVAVGENQPAEVHALAYAINHALGNAGQTIFFHTPVQHEPLTGPSQLKALVEEINAGKVETLVVSSWNPVYGAPADIDFAAALGKVPLSIYLGMFEDETAPHATWFVPQAHPLEMWGDARSQDGTTSIIQPLINPLFGGMTEYDVLAALLERPETTTHQLLQEYWSGKVGAAGFSTQWEEWLSKGVIPGQELQPFNGAADAEKVATALRSAPGTGPGLELNFVPAYGVYDGRFANAPWLQELPDPVTKLTWDNAVQLSEATAKQLKVETGGMLKLTVGGQSLEAAAMIVPGHADNSLTLALGYGRSSSAEGIAQGVGFAANKLRLAAMPWIATGVEAKATGDDYDFSLTQVHNTLEGTNGVEREGVVVSQTLEEFKKKNEAEELRGALPTLLEPVVYEGYQWAMAVDMSRCTGCSACVVACQAENNIPTVGKEQVGKNREMHWLRIDRYFTGEAENPETVNQPMACQHCEAAPCEYVCPVNATTHSDEGLNDMVYNRCIGTRYCSNNCPYKVRRFNYLHWNAEKDPMVQMAMNPDVTVRARGVMEKCTYCVQRIERVRIQARIEGRDIRKGELVTACQQACPTHAITFGTLSQDDAEVTQWHRDERRFDVLHALNTRPRTAYLTKITNPNPELA